MLGVRDAQRPGRPAVPQAPDRIRSIEGILLEGGVDMFFSLAVVLSLLGIVWVVAPGLLRALTNPAVLHGGELSLLRPTCVHELACAATGIACSCPIGGPRAVVLEAERIVRDAWASGRG